MRQSYLVRNDICLLPSSSPVCERAYWLRRLANIRFTTRQRTRAVGV